MIKNVIIVSWVAVAAFLTACGSADQVSDLAGRPDQDPVVAAYRGLFQSSWGPTEADLAMGAVWVCHYRYAYRNNFGEGRDITYVFRGQGRFVQNIGSASPKTLVIGLTGMASNVQNYSYVMRVTNEGTLVGEWSTAAGLFPANYSVPAIADPRRRAYAYEECRLGRPWGPALDPAAEPTPPLNH